MCNQVATKLAGWPASKLGSRFQSHLKVANQALPYASSIASSEFVVIRSCLMPNTELVYTCSLFVLFCVV